MLYLLIRLVINAIALWVAIQIVPGLEFGGSWPALLSIALIFGVVNAVVRPIILFFSCPLIILTLGLFILVVNTIMLSLTVWLAGPRVLDLGLTSTGFWATFFGALIISLVSGLLNMFVKSSDEPEMRVYHTDHRR